MSITYPRYSPRADTRPPGFYADPGPPGFYPQLQTYPSPIPLEVRYSTEWQRDIWIQPLSLLIRGLPRPVRQDHIKEYFRAFNLLDIEGLKSYHGHFQSDKQNVILHFGHRLDAIRALEHTYEQHRLGRRTYFIFPLAVNVSGRNAWTTSDVLLVRDRPAGDLRLQDNTFGSTSPSRTCYDQTLDAGPSLDRPLKRLRPGHLNGMDAEQVAFGPKRAQAFEACAPVDDSISTSVPAPADSWIIGSRDVPPTSDFTFTYAPSRRQLQSDRYRPLSVRSLTPPCAGLGSLDRFDHHLELSTHPAYSEPALTACPTWVATVGDVLVLAMTRESIQLKYARAQPIQLDELDGKSLEQLGMERVQGYRWKVKHDTQRAWREGGGCVSLLARTVANGAVKAERRD